MTAGGTGSPATESSDQELLTRLARGEPLAAEALHRRHARFVFTLARQWVGSVEDAEEVSQEVFLALFRQPERFDPDTARFTTFLGVIIRNKAVDLLRKRRRGHVSDEDALAALPDTRTAGPAEKVAAAERIAATHARLAQVPERQREALMLVHAGHSYEKVAECLGITVGAARILVCRARKAIRDGDGRTD